VTDINGIYELYDVPLGKYSIQPMIPKGLKFLMAIHYGSNVRLKTRSLEIELKDGGCSGTTILLETVDQDKVTTTGGSRTEQKAFGKKWK
jgi:hypothetical protein